MITDEITCLLIYGFVTGLLLLAKTMGMIATIDMGYLLSARDEKRTLEGMLGRMDRALNNSVIALALVAPPILVIALKDQGSPASLLAAQVFLLARLIYVPSYMFGIRGLRTLVFVAGFAATFVLYFLAF